MPQLVDYLDRNKDAFEAELCELLAIPSVSADSRHKEDVQRGCRWVAEKLRRLGLQVEVLPTSGHPIVYAESPPVAGAPTVLVYGHYDVQPADPLDEWISPPFEPTRRDGNIYARGATDDKGQMLTHVFSVQAWMETAGALPLQVKFLIEGEEETGSAGLHKLLDAEPSRLACDIVVISDTSQFGPGQPAITYGLKGIAYYELHLRGPRQDLHSGSFGGAVANPANALCGLLAGLVDDQGRVRIPGFYDDVQPLTETERRRWAALPFSEANFMKQIGVKGVSGEVGYSTLERRVRAPTCDINGIWGGYQGEGAKTVLPATAGAKFSFRLVPDQDPGKVTEALRQFLEASLPQGVLMELVEVHGAPGFVTSPDSPYTVAAAKAIEQGFVAGAAVFIREGGSIPIVTAAYEKLGVDSLLLGWGLDDDNTHSPNEKFNLGDFHRGIRASAHLWQSLSEITPEPRPAS